MTETKRLKKRLISILTLAIKERKYEWNWELEKTNLYRKFIDKDRYKVKYYKQFSNYTLILINGRFKVRDDSVSRSTKVICKFLLWGFIPTNKIFFYYLYLTFIRHTNNYQIKNREKSAEEKRTESEYKSIIGSLEDDLKQEIRKEKLDKLK